MGKATYHGPLERVDECCWRIPKSYKHGMRVDGLIFADERLLEQIKKDQAPEQVANVAFLPGIQHASLAMPDIHWGYGFCIGGVCATNPDEGGVISPGGVGYDINCGVRLVRSNLFYREAKPHLRTLVDELFRQVPTGAGKSHLSAAIGLALVENGWRVLFARTTDLVQRLQVARRELTLEATIAKLDRYDLLILDDIAYVSKDHAETSVLFELIAARYEQRSLLITANQPFGRSANGARSSPIRP